jgi:hypothetical protein
MSDYNCIDVIREAQATVVAAAQSSTSFVPPLGREKARVFTLNLRNRLIFRAADEEGALESSDFLGKHRVIKKSWGYSVGKPHAITRSRRSTRSSRTSSAGMPQSTRRRDPLRAWSPPRVATACRGRWPRVQVVWMVTSDESLILRIRGKQREAW